MQKFGIFDIGVFGMASFRLFVCFVVVLSLSIASTGFARQITSNSWLSYWNQKLPSVQVPKDLPALASPLTPADTSAFVQKLQLGTVKAVDGVGLCQASNMLCGEKAIGPQVCVDPYFYEYGTMRCAGHGAANSEMVATGIFFDQGDLVKGNKMIYPKLTNDLAGRTFLPAGLAKAMPFSKSSLSEEYVFLNVPSDSNMARSMQATLAFCESAPPQGEIRTCHSSIESMVDFAASNMGTDLTVLSPEYASSESQQVTVRADPLTLSGSEKSSMTCHDLSYPYLVYGCHIMASSQIMDLELETDKGLSFHATAVCHTDTSTWNEGHPAFAALGVKPGESSVCHWVPQNNFVWINSK